MREHEIAIFLRAHTGRESQRVVENSLECLHTFPVIYLCIGESLAREQPGTALRIGILN